MKKKNCNYPYPDNGKCQAVKEDAPTCECRFCVFNDQFPCPCMD